MKRESPDMSQEKDLWRGGRKLIAGIDEVGRGAWAGPVVAASVVFGPDHTQLELVKDSKMLTSLQREKLYSKIVSECLDYGLGIVSHIVIDQIGIGQATKHAMQEAVTNLKNYPDYILVDAVNLDGYCDCDYQAIIKGDQKIYSISCASIIAKVNRDRQMSSLDEKYKHYKFELHKGYGTKIHQEALLEYGPCDLHRYSYRPIGKLI